jgi:hypothetical protein
MKELRKFFSDGGCSMITTAEKACYTGNYAILLARHLSIRRDNAGFSGGHNSRDFEN